jgi:hypothetical protein
VAGVPKASSITERASTPISRTPSLKSFPTECVRTPGSPPYSRFTSKTRHGAPARISPRRMTFARCDFPEPFAPTITFTFSNALPPGENSSPFQRSAKENLWARGFGDRRASREDLRIPAGEDSVPGAADLGPGDPFSFFSFGPHHLEEEFSGPSRRRRASPSLGGLGKETKASSPWKERRESPRFKGFLLPGRSGGLGSPRPPSSNREIRAFSSALTAHPLPPSPSSG